MKVTFDNVYNAFQIIAPKGTMISFTGEPTALADGVYLVGDDGIINLDEQFLTDTLYLSTEGTDYAVTGGMRVTYPLGDETVIIRAGSSTIPFSKGGKGGGSSGGDNTHYKGTTTTPISNGSTTNPITIDGESYTAVFGDIAVYNYTEFVFDGSAWSEFGRPFDTTPTNRSANAVTSDGIYSLIHKGVGVNSAVVLPTSTASAQYSVAIGHGIVSNQNYQVNVGRFNSSKQGDIFEIGNGWSNIKRSNIVEVTNTEFNINGDIKKNNVSLPTPYTTMPTITSEMLGQIAQYVGETTNDYVKGYFYIASSDGAAEPTYTWVHLPTQNGYSETVLYTASSPHTNNIELSQEYTNFDDIVVVWTYSAPSDGEYHNRFQQAFKTSALVADDTILIGEATSSGDFTAYTVVDTTHINFTQKTGTYYNWISKVIGINYGSNGGAVANPVRSLAKSEEKEKPIEEEPVKEDEPVEELKK